MITRRSTIVSVFALALGLAACGSATPTAAPATVAGAATTVAGAATPGTGTGGTAGAGGGNSANGAARQAAFAAYTACMKDNGVTLPAFTGRPANGTTPTTVAGATPGTGDGGGANGGFGGGGFNGYRPGSATAPAGVDQATYTKALAACQSKLPTGGFGGGGRLTNTAYVACMKDNGVVLPAPPVTTVAGASAPASTAPASSVPRVDRTSAAYVAANAKCKVLLPNGGAPTATNDGGSTTTTAG